MLFGNDSGGGNKRTGRQRASRAFQASRAGARRSCAQQRTHQRGGSPRPVLGHPGLVSEPNCVAARRGGEHGGGERMARRRTNVIRRDGWASERAGGESALKRSPGFFSEAAVDLRLVHAKEEPQIHGVVDDGTSGRCVTWTGDTCRRQSSARKPAGIRGAIVPEKPAKAGGWEGHQCGGYRGGRTT